MAGLILCKSKYSEKPYYISNMAVNVYSVEEICYYIYNNIYIIGMDMFDEGLISYIDKELGESELAKQLEFLINQRAGLSELVLSVLRYVDYYSAEEIARLKDVIERLDVQNVAERLKARADNFLKNKCYTSAIKNYELIVYGKKDKSLSVDFYGNVWHNMGVAYAGLFSFYDAGVAFRTAYELNGREESKKAFYSALCLEKGGTDDEATEEMYVCCREIETIFDEAATSEKLAYIHKAYELKEEGKISEYQQMIKSVVEKWCEEYRHYIR